MHGEAHAIDGCASLQLVDRGAQDVPVPDPDVEWGQPGELTEERTDEWVVGIASACPPSPGGPQARLGQHRVGQRSEGHTSELQSLMRTSYAVFCLKKKTHNN